MPKIDVSYKDLCGLVGRRIEMKNLMEKDILFAKGEVDDVIGDAIKVDIKDANRPDLWSTEGIAREIRYRYGGKFPDYKTLPSKVVVNVDKSVSAVRPLTVCAVVRDLDINDTLLSQLIQLQEKIAGTFGRNRREVAIGVYDLDKIKPPISYTTAGKDEVKFVPLEFERELTPQEILQKHPKGKEFGKLLAGATRYPLFIDSEKNVLSMPPIINSAHTGKVGAKTKNIFIECSGFDFRFLMPAINIITAALYERGGAIEKTKVNYGRKSIETPDMEPKKFLINADYINRVSGLDLNKNDALKLLENSGYKATTKGSEIRLLYPAYRQDIMHARDVAEDAVLSYGYDKIKPEMQKFATAGSTAPIEPFLNKISEILVGVGLQEIMSYTLTNKRDVFEKMRIHNEKLVELENPMSANWGVFRGWLLPGMMGFLSKNKHVAYPQKIFEIGTCVILDERAETKTKDLIKLSACISNSEVSYDEISSVLHVMIKNLGLGYETKPHGHKSFIPGRCAGVFVGGKNIGVAGEIHPGVLNNWGLEKPVVAFEIDLSEIFQIKYGKP